MSRIFLTLFSDSAKRQPEAVKRLTSLCALLALCPAILFSASCATNRLERPPYAAGNIESLLSEKENIKSLKSSFAIELEKDGNLLKGDAVLRLGPESLDLQVYSLGLLVAEVSEDNGAAKSIPAADRNKLSLLVDGLRSSFFWWTIKDPGIISDADSYHLYNSWKRLLISRKTMLPVKQTVELENGKKLEISYQDPVLVDGIWFPSKIRIKLARYSVNIAVKTLIFNPEQNR